MIEIEKENSTLGESYRKFEEEKDFIFFETHQKKQRMLTRIYLRPALGKATERDESTQFVICGQYLCWRVPYELRIQIVNVKDMTE